MYLKTIHDSFQQEKLKKITRTVSWVFCCISFPPRINYFKSQAIEGIHTQNTERNALDLSNRRNYYSKQISLNVNIRVIFSLKHLHGLIHTCHNFFRMHVEIFLFFKKTLQPAYTLTLFYQPAWHLSLWLHMKSCSQETAFGLLQASKEHNIYGIIYSFSVKLHFYSFNTRG